MITNQKEKNKGHKKQDVLFFILKYGFIFALGCIVMLIWSSWHVLTQDFYSKPIILKGLSGVTFSLAFVKILFILSISTVVGIGLAVIAWFLKEAQVETNQHKV